MPVQSYEKFRQTCLMGRVDQALIMVDKNQGNNFTEKQKAKVRAIKKRFKQNTFEKKLPLDSVEYIIYCYEQYWHRSLMNIKKRSFYEKTLVLEIKKWLLSNFKIKSTSKNCYSKLQAAIKRKGLNCLTGRVSHLQELEIWKKQTKKVFSISLLESNQKVKVIFMSKYLTYGWMAYATCNASKVGGWAKARELFCNASEYNIHSEDFKASYLAHEAQHFSDYKKFKKLDSYALEYRAKLAEIIHSRRTTKKVISRFKAQSSKTRHSYHHFAAYKLITNLGNSIDQNSSQIRATAENLLLADSRLRKKTGFKSL